MQVLSRKVLMSAGLMIAVSSISSAQNLPYGLKQSKAAASVASVAAVSSATKALKGQYTFAVHGAAVGGQSVSREEGVVGSIIADGKGNITSGEEDFNS